VNKGRDTRISIGGDQSGILAVGGSVISVSGRQETLDPNLVPEVMAKLEEIVRALDGLLDSARAATEEGKKRPPRRDLVLARLREISTDLTTAAGLVAAVKPLLG